VADQRIITLYGGDVTPSTIVLRALPVASVVTTTITLYGLDSTPSTIILRDPTQFATSGLATAAPTTGLVTVIGYQPTIATTGVVEGTASPITATLTVNGLLVTQQTFTTLLPGTATVGFAGYSPAALAENQIGATTGFISVLGYAPSLTLEAVITPSTGAVALLGYVPAVDAGGIVVEATVTPDTAILGASGFIPFVENEATGKSAKYRNRRTKYWYDEPKLPDPPVVTPSLPENPPALNVVAIPQSEIGAEIERVNREIADASQKLEAYRRRRAKRREEEAIIALLAA